MINGLKKSFILTAAAAASLFIAAPASANVKSNLVDTQAVNQFTASVKNSLKAYDSLYRGDVTTARQALTQALQSLDQATAKDPTLGFAQKSANTLKRELSAIKTSMDSKNTVQVRDELHKVLTSAGVITS